MKNDGGQRDICPGGNALRAAPSFSGASAGRFALMSGMFIGAGLKPGPLVAVVKKPETENVPEERTKAIEAALLALEGALTGAIRGGEIKDGLQWTATIATEPDPYIVVLSVARVEAKAQSRIRATQAGER